MTFARRIRSKLGFIYINYTLQRHCTENWKRIFPEMKLRDLVPNSYIHVSFGDLYIPTIGPPIWLWIHITHIRSYLLSIKNAIDTASESLYWVGWVPKNAGRCLCFHVVLPVRSSCRRGTLSLSVLPERRKGSERSGRDISLKNIQTKIILPNSIQKFTSESFIKKVFTVKRPVRQWTLTSTPFFRLYLSMDKSCQNIKKYGGILWWRTQMSSFDLHQFCLFNKTVTKLGIAEW